MPGSVTPVTLPPPPFSSEAEVTGSEWWLESHMNLAGNLTLLDQLVESPQATRGVRAVAKDLSDLRDALYELYCDAADPRMKDWTADGAPFSTYIKGLYAWADGVCDAYSTFVARLKTTGIDSTSLKLSLNRVARLVDDALVARIEDGLTQLPVDASSPVDPIRSLHKDLEELFSVVRALKARLGP
jgi:hypothetical protein